MRAMRKYTKEERVAIEAAAKEERVTAEVMTNSAEKGQWLALDYRGTPLVARPTRIDALKEGIEWAQRKRFAVCGFVSEVSR